MPGGASNLLSTSADDPFVELVDRLTSACLLGEPFDLEMVAAEYPDYKEQLAELGPTLAALAQWGSASPADGDVLTGHALGDFRLIREVGRGGMGVVFEAEQLSLGRRVAVKILPFAALLDPTRLERFRNEARAAATLKHPNIVRIFSVGVERGVHYYAMELIEGQSLAEVIAALRQSRDKSRETRAGEESVVSGQLSVAKKTPPTDHGQLTTDKSAADQAASISGQQLTANSQRPPQSEIRNPKSEIETEAIAALSTEYSTNPKHYFRRVAEIGIQVAEALHHAHEHGILHRDVKPANILLDADGKAWITDFGLARLEADASVTATGDLLGTLRYMSPEQISGGQVGVDHRTDIYSLGVTLYELATLRPAFTGSDRQELLRKLLEENPPPPRRQRAEVPRDLETIVLKATAKESHLRYGSARDLADDLLRYVNDEPIRARRPSASDRVFRWTRRHKSAVLALLVILLMGVASLSLGLYQQTQAHHQSLQLTDQLTQQLYASKIALAQEAIQNHRVAEALEHLNACPLPLRGWEWRYLRYQADRSLRVVPVASSVAHMGGSPVFSPDGTLLAIARGARLTALDPAALDLVWSWSWDEEETSWIQCAAFSSDSRRLVVGMGKGHAVMLDGQNGQEIYRIPANPSSYGIFGAAFTEDGKWFATCDQAGSLAMWTTDSGNVVWRMATDSSPATLISLDLCGDRLVTVDVSNDVVKIFETQSGALVRELVDPSLVASHGHVAHADNPTCAMFSPDGSRIVTTGDDGMIKLWDSESGALLASRKGHEDYARIAAFSPDGQWIAAAGRDSTIRIFHADNLEPYAILDGHQDYTYGVAWNPDGRTLVSCGDDNTLRVWDALTGPNPRTISGHLSWFRRSPREDATVSFAYTSKGALLISNHVDWRIGSLVTVWLPDLGQELANLCGTCSRMFDLNDLATTEGPGTIVGAGADARIYIWDLPESPARALAGIEASSAGVQAHLPSAEHLVPHVIPNASGYPVLAVDITENGDVLAWADSRGDVVFWDLAHNTARPGIHAAHRGAVRDISFSPDFRRLATAGDDGQIRVWDAETGERLHELAGHEGPVHAVAFSPDGRLLASAGADRAVLLWDATSGELLSRHLSHAGLVRTVGFHPSEPRFVSASADGTVKVWSPTVDQPLLTLRPPLNVKLTGREVYTAKFSPDGNSLLAGIEDGTIRVWETQSTSRQWREWQAIDLARRLVDALAQEHELYARVTDVLASDHLNIKPRTRSLAMEIARARLVHDNWASRVQMVRYDNSFELSILFPGAAAADLERTLAQLRHADELQPEDPKLLWWIGAALYRLARYQEALDVLNLEESRDRSCLGAPSMRTAACKAMVLHQLGRTDEARAELALAHELLNEPIWSEYKHIAYFRLLIREADTLITGRSGVPDLRTEDISRSLQPQANAREPE